MKRKASPQSELNGPPPMSFLYDDGGRNRAGFKGHVGDCVTRAIVIATSRPYREVYDRLAEGMFTQRATKGRGRAPRSAANGILTDRKWFKDYMKELGFTWVPTMFIGQGCKVHLHDGELPNGKLVVALSKHLTAVIDQVIHDIYDPRREVYWSDAIGNSGIWRRCVYGYWILKQ